MISTRKMKTIVNIADMKVTGDPEATLVTYSLGSCIGLAIYDPIAKVGGLLHFMLPDSSVDPQKAHRTPCMFADTGVAALFAEAYRLGADKNRIEIKVAGGSQVMNRSSFLNIGKRNLAALQDILETRGLTVSAEDVGGYSNRTVSLQLSSGKVFVKSSATEAKEL